MRFSYKFNYTTERDTIYNSYNNVTIELKVIINKIRTYSYSLCCNLKEPIVLMYLTWIGFQKKKKNDMIN